MRIIIHNTEEEITPSRITVVIGSKEFTISVNNTDDLVINKQVFDEKDGAIIIRPSVSNEIRIS